jgi:hypothetical protein
MHAISSWSKSLRARYQGKGKCNIYFSVSTLIVCTGISSLICLKLANDSPRYPRSYASDLSSAYGPGDTVDHTIRFAASLYPNGSTEIHWPECTIDVPKMLTLLDGDIPLALTNDIFKCAAVHKITQLSLEGSNLKNIYKILIVISFLANLCAIIIIASRIMKFSYSSPG